MDGERGRERREEEERGGKKDGEKERREGKREGERDGERWRGREKSDRPGFEYMYDAGGSCYIASVKRAVHTHTMHTSMYICIHAYRRLMTRLTF